MWLLLIAVCFLLKQGCSLKPHILFLKNVTISRIHLALIKVHLIYELLCG